MENFFCEENKFEFLARKKIFFVFFLMEIYKITIKKFSRIFFGRRGNFFEFWREKKIFQIFSLLNQKNQFKIFFKKNFKIPAKEKKLYFTTKFPKTRKNPAANVTPFTKCAPLRSSAHPALFSHSHLALTAHTPTHRIQHSTQKYHKK